jgi:hypothetical protein
MDVRSMWSQGSAKEVSDTLPGAVGRAKGNAISHYNEHLAED